MEARGPQVTIEFEAGAAERIAGRLLDEHGTSVTFEGWLGLAAVLERVLAPTVGPDAVANPDQLPN